MAIFNGTAGNDTFTGDADLDELYGNAGNDVLVFGTDTTAVQADILDGGDDNDWIQAGKGSTARGGAGTDHLLLDLSDVTSNISFSVAAQASAATLLVDGTSVEGFEHFDLRFGGGDDTLNLVGATLASTFYKGASQETAVSTFHGGAGSDTLRLGANTTGNASFNAFEYLVADFSTLSSAVNVSVSRATAGGRNWTFTTDLLGIDVVGGAGKDVFVGGLNATNTINGGAGNDRMEGGLLADRLIGGDGNDYIQGGGGADILRGGNGDDILYAGSSGEPWEQPDARGAHLDGGAGNDTILGTVGQTLIGGVGVDTLELGFNGILGGVDLRLSDQANGTLQLPGQTYVQGFEEFILSLGRGNDVVDAKDFHFTRTDETFFYGEAGVDILIVDDGTTGFANVYQFERLLVDFSTSSQSVNVSYYSVISRNLRISSDGFDFVTVKTGSGNDFISGRVVFADAGAGDDKMGLSNDGKYFGRSGNDYFTLDAKFTGVVNGGAGQDTLVLRTFANFLGEIEGVEILQLYGGNFTADFLNSFETIIGVNGKLKFNLVGGGKIGKNFAENAYGEVTGGGQADNIDISHVRGDFDLYGLRGNDVLVGGLGRDTIYGGLGNDVLDGGAGSNRLYGEEGNDRFLVSAGRHTIDGGSGFDTIVSTISYTLGREQNIERLQLAGRADINGTGSSESDNIAGNAGKNVLRGQDGNDVLSGGAGDDRLFGDNGRDRLTGGAGKDSFIFDGDDWFWPNGVDTVTDFSVRDDTMVLEVTDIVSSMKRGTLAASAFVVNTTGRAADADDRVIYNSLTGQLFFDGDGNVGQAPVLIANLDANLALTHKDFIIA